MAQFIGPALRPTHAIAAAKRGDLVVIQYSGHGSFVPDGDADEPDGTDECICPWDIGSKDPIADDELFDLYGQRAHGVKLAVISDSCHSGTVAKFAPITTPPTIAGRGAPLARQAGEARIAAGAARSSRCAS